jgi:hypothetical protein
LRPSIMHLNKGFRRFSSFKVNPLYLIFVPRFADWEEHMAKLMSKSELIQKIADQLSNALTRKDIKGVIESLASVGYKELKRTGGFFVPRIREICCH